MRLKRDVKSLRAYNNITQQEIADVLGVGVQRVKQIEANQEAVSLRQLLEIYHYLGYDLVVGKLEKEEG